MSYVGAATTPVCTSACYWRYPLGVAPHEWPACIPRGTTRAGSGALGVGRIAACLTGAAVEHPRVGCRRGRHSTTEFAYAIGHAGTWDQPAHRSDTQQHIGYPPLPAPELTHPADAVQLRHVRLQED